MVISSEVMQSLFNKKKYTQVFYAMRFEKCYGSLCKALYKMFYWLTVCQF